MVTRDEIRILARLRHPEGVVSAYVAVRPNLVYEPMHPLAAFKSAAQRYLQQSTDPVWRRALARERPRIQRWLEGRRPTGRGIVFFASKPLGLWEARTLAFPMPTLVVVDSAPYTALLTQALDEGEAMVVVHIQRDGAHLWVSEQNETEDRGTLAGQVQGRHAAGGWSQARFQRHIEVQAAQHRARVLEELLRVNAERSIRRLVVGGAEPTLSDFVRELPAPLPSRLVGTFPVDGKHDGEDEILARAQQVVEDAERASEKRLVQEMLDASAAGGPGVLGLDRTLSALLEGRVRTLLVAEGERQEGAVCSNCDYLAAKPFESCPLCGARADRTPDVVGVAMERALLSGAQVESLLGEAREELLRRGHPVAAILRY
jgi:peptide chain release factor subunit 1